MEITITYHYIVGIDISKKTLDVYLYDRTNNHGDYFQVLNAPAGFEQLDRRLTEQDISPEQTLLPGEHCGRYAEHLLRWSTETGWPHAVVKTTALQKVGPEHHRKSDAWDARGLAEYARRYSDRLTLTEAPKAALRQLKRLRAERRKMVDQRAGLKAKGTEAGYHDADMDELLKMWSQQIDLLSEHIDQIDQQISQLITQPPQLQQRSRQMRSAPGMGKVLGMCMADVFCRPTNT